jgi:hypothetical protein
MSARTPDIDDTMPRILKSRSDAEPNVALLVGVSGIDGSGKRSTFRLSEFTSPKIDHAKSQI